VSGPTRGLSTRGHAHVLALLKFDTKLSNVQDAQIRKKTQITSLFSSILDAGSRTPSDGSKTRRVSEDTCWDGAPSDHVCGATIFREGNDISTLAAETDIGKGRRLRKDREKRDRCAARVTRGYCSCKKIVKKTNGRRTRRQRGTGAGEIG
jgi:hypothetical protein